MARAAGAASAALLRDDPLAARQALQELQAACRSLAPEEDERFGRGFRSSDQALHLVIGNTISLVVAGELDRASDEFVWVQRTCRHCHGLARAQGFLPAKGPLWDVGSADPPTPVEKAQSTDSER